MGARLIDLPWDSQPQEAVQPAVGIDFATTFAAHEWTEVGNGRSVEPFGVAFKGNASSVYAFREVSGILAPPLWFATWFRTESTPASNRQLVALGADASLGAFFGLRVSTNAFGLNLFFRSSNGGNFFEVGSGASAAYLSGESVCVVGVAPSASSSDAYLYVNGVKHSTVVASATLTGTPAIAKWETVNALRRNSVSEYGPFSVYATARGRSISESFAKAASLDPGQLFAPQQIYIPRAAAAPALPTLSLPRAKSGSITATGFIPQWTAS
jgi:hypothetical protein